MYSYIWDSLYIKTKCGNVDIPLSNIIDYPRESFTPYSTHLGVEASLWVSKVNK